MSMVPVVKMSRLKAALRNVTSTPGNDAGFQSAHNESIVSKLTSDELRQLEGIAIQLALEVDGDVLATYPRDEIRGTVLRRALRLGADPFLKFQVAVPRDHPKACHQQHFMKD